MYKFWEIFLSVDFYIDRSEAKPMESPFALSCSLSSQLQSGWELLTLQ